ncbi:MAG: primosomal protein N' [Planctomycetota bacterium]
MRFASVALDLPLTKEFTYRVPGPLLGRVDRGSRVRVPFGKRLLSGVVVGLGEESGVPADKLRELQHCFEEIPRLPPEVLAFTRAMAEEYACSWGTALEAALPGSLKRRPSRTLPALSLARPLGDVEDALHELEDAAPKRARALRAVVELGSPAPLAELRRRTGLSSSPFDTLVRQGWLARSRVLQDDELLAESRGLEHAPRHEPTAEQAAAVEAVVADLRAGRPGTSLLWGVTGSGKTEVYLRILEQVVAMGKGAIILVPEISLTPQTVGRFLSRFPEVAVLHSSLSDATRARQWLRLARGELRIVVGARSALFAPVRDLGLVVVDEEHEPSYKQQSRPRYHAREMAVLRGRLEGAAVVLGSATPSLESWHRARTGDYRLLRLTSRVGGARMPRTLTVDMRHEKTVRVHVPLLSKQLERLMRDRLAAGGQALLFLNRRGFAPVLFCNACGEVVRCPHCEVPMVWHVRRGRLLCHYCHEERRRPELCPSCASSSPVPLGSGTERVEDVVRARFPEVVVARMDSDTMARRDSHEKVLAAFRRREIDVLIGTQMIAKGLDFPEVTLVGVVSADTGLYLPDFRASERVFQLLSQVAGRAGRGEREGLCVVQTSCPEALPIARALEGDYEGFAATELEARERLGYPPFGRLARIVVEGPDQARASARCKELASRLRGRAPSVTVLGPAPAPFARLKDRWRFHVVLKCPDERTFTALRPELQAVSEESDRHQRVLVDVDPTSML